jgi:hypothetical protein
MGCDMTFGASGGPWLWRYTPNNSTGNHVNSVVSGHDSTGCTGGFGQTFNGPRFTTSNIVLLCDDENC